MITVRKSSARGHADHGWLDSHHTFSFADYHDPAQMGFGTLRVINEDRVAPGQGFGTHGHRDMEIVTYVLEGALEHKDSMGTSSVIRPGEVQRMTAGRGVTHSEFNASKTAPVHFLQIWLLPEKPGLDPSYEQRELGAGERGALQVVASRAGGGGTVTIHQDTTLLVARLTPGERATHALARGRRAYVHVARGAATLNGERLVAGDGARCVDEAALELASETGGEVLVFDMP